MYGIPLRWQTPPLRWLCLAALASAPALLCGCGAEGRQRVVGTVTFDGKPLEQGNIAFRPHPGTASPSAGAKILDGKFSIPPEAGLLPGNFRIVITATRPTNKKQRDHFTGEMTTLEEQFIPAKYNTQSQLEAIVESNGTSDLDLRLTRE